jgi:hypothetical protein
VPLAHQGRMVPGSPQQIGQRGHTGIEPSPGRVLMTPGTPTRSGYLPVNKAALDGEHTVAFALMRVNRIPCEASRSRCGVWTSAFL